MKPLLLSFALTISFLHANPEGWDWREALLKAEGIEDTPEAMRAALEQPKAPAEELNQTLSLLASDEFDVREKAQKELLRRGEAIYPWLRQQEKHPQPEVRRRVQSILRRMGLDERKSREEALQFALRSLLEEGQNRRRDTGSRFYEWFGDPSNDVSKGYHLFEMDRTVKRGGKVSGGVLRLEGNGLEDGEQRFVLRSKSWPGRDDFGTHFTVIARLGGEADGSGSWHLGVSIGKVRALYHPLYRGGGFRFEEIRTTKYLSNLNGDLGFTPDGDPPESMKIEVRRLPAGKTSLTVTITQGGESPKVFKKELVVANDVIGPLNQISLDRSGRRGGEAFFSDLQVTLHN